MSKTAAFDGLEIEFRALDETKRMASFVAATENGVMSWRGKEVLRMSGARLARFAKNPVVLDNHDRFGSVESIVGRAEMRVEGKQLNADIFFADTTRGTAAWELVKKGFLRTVSIGFIPDPASIVDLRQGQFDGEGESRVDGPGRVINRWEVFEVSVVPVPADPDALRRHFEELSMTTQNTQQPAAPAAPAPAPAAAAVPPAQTRAANVESITEIKEESFRRSVVALAPRSMKPDVVDRIILEANGDLEAARKRMLEEQTRLTPPPVGTPEPAAVPPAAKPGEQQRAQETEPAKVAAADDLLVRSLCSPSGL